MLLIQSDRILIIIIFFLENSKLNEYLSTEGIVTEPDYKQRMSRWSYNHCDIPLPSFIDLYIEQATAPFFVFQVKEDIVFWFYEMIFFVLK